MKKKNKRLIGAFLVVIALVLFVGGPIVYFLDIEPLFCVQGDFPNIRLTSCEPNLDFTSVARAPKVEGLDTSSRTAIIVDDDGSLDGMIALLYFLGHPEFEVRAVTISHGIAHPARFAPHLQNMLAALGRGDIPVGVGRETPLEGNNVFPEVWREGSDNFWGIALPQASVLPEPTAAAELIVRTVVESMEPVTIFVSGSHTNLAEALRLAPEITAKISNVEVMGGAVKVEGNINKEWPEFDNSVAEWNIYVDPVAAAEVFQADVHINLTPLDATDRVLWRRAELRDWAESATPEGVLAAQMLQVMLDMYRAEGTVIWDLVAAINTTNAEYCPVTPVAMKVVTEAGPTQGQTVTGGGIPNTEVCLDPDVRRMRETAAKVFGN